LPFPATFAAELTGNFEAGAGSFDGEFTLHLRQAGHYVEEEASRRRARIDSIGEALELNALFVKISDEIDQILYASAEPIQLPHDEGVAVAKGLLRLDERGSFGAAAGDLIFPLRHRFLSKLIEGVG
jgi:hypothetical protein